MRAVALQLWNDGVNPTNPPMHVTHHASTFVAQPDKERCSRPSPPGAFLYTAHVPGVWWGPQGNQPARRRLWTLHLPQRDRGREEATYVCSSTHSASERCLHLLNVASLTLGQLTPLGSSLAPLSPHQRCAVAFKVYDVDGVGYITRALMLAAMLPEEDRDAVVEAFPEVRVSFRVVFSLLSTNTHATQTQPLAYRSLLPLCTPLTQCLCRAHRSLLSPRRARRWTLKRLTRGRRTTLP
jgi:hypothetical protein